MSKRADEITVPLLDLKAQYQKHRPAIEGAIREVCESQYFILGPKVQTLESEIAEYTQCGHAVGVSSGTDALLIALMALDIGAGDEVITTPYTFFATGGVVSRLGARPVFCDIDPISFNLSPAAVQRFIAEHCELRDGVLRNRSTGGNVRVLMPVHLYGQMADMDALLAIAADSGLRVVEDAAQAIGSEMPDGRRAGGLGDIGCFSFFPSKNLGAFGDAGMCTTNDAELADRLRILRVHGGRPKYYHAMIGGNFRLDALHAAVLSVKLPYLDQWTGKRQQNAAFYDQAFAALGIEGLSTPTVMPGYRHIFNQYVIRVPARRDELRQFLGDQRIGTEIYYPVPLHVQQCFADLGYAPGDCGESVAAADQTLAVPVYPELSDAQLQHVVDSVGKFYA